MENPCRNCVEPKRCPGCHDKCAERKRWLFLEHITWKREYEERLVNMQMYEMTVERNSKPLRRKPEPLRHGRKIVNR